MARFPLNCGAESRRNGVCRSCRLAGGSRPIEDVAASCSSELDTLTHAFIDFPVISKETFASLSIVECVKAPQGFHTSSGTVLPLEPGLSPFCALRCFSAVDAVVTRGRSEIGAVAADGLFFFGGPDRNRRR
eukprot:scaffold3953_cov236-Pinguiococcus_pyrenoidosus.AAC.8